MRSYLSLIPISARVHRRQNRMTLLCMVFAVFMVTAVFSMAEMGARMEQARLLNKHGNLSLPALFGSTMGQSLLLTALVLFLLVLVAGVLMIAGSISSSVAQRTKFFGMMRCLGMSRRQIMTFVRLETLNWCKTAIPTGLALGITATWVLCAALRFLVGEEFSYIPLFKISGIGILSGVLVGVVTVLLAAQSPARRAAGVSPIAAVSGHLDDSPISRRQDVPSLLPLEAALGIRHALSARKSLFLMTGSFALSILLFLSFSVLVDFVDCLMPQSAAVSDIDISSSDGGCSIPARLADTLQDMEGVKEVYGRRTSFGVPAMLEGADGVDLVSFDGFDLACLEKDDMLIPGSDLSKIYGDSRYVLATWDRSCPWEIGDAVLLNGEVLEIAGLLRYDLFSDDGLTGGRATLIVSGETFFRLTGIADYALVMVQLSPSATEEDVSAIYAAAGNEYHFRDKRDQKTAGTYLSFLACVYAFLAVIALVTVLNIINSISMSVSARTRQYGAMRAVGMSGGQVTRMIAAEALTYALLGCGAGCAAGLPLHHFLYTVLITNHFPYAVWRLPVSSLALTFLFVLFAAAAAVCAPAKRMAHLSVTEAISEL